MNIPFVMKKCSKCGEWKVASTVNYHRNKDCRYGLASKCKECKNKQNKQWRLDNKDKVIEYCEANKDKKREYDKQYRETNKEKIAEYKKQYYENNKEKVAEYHKQYREDNKEKIAMRDKQYRENNKEKIAEWQKQYREANKDKKREYDKQYYQDNKEKIKQYREANRDKRNAQHKQWYQANKERRAEYRQSPQGQVAAFNGYQRRRAREEEQGTGITKDQWLEMMQYFDWKCAYSGETLSNKTRSVDHIVPLNSGGDNMIWNCVPMTRSLNSSKQANNMEEWYREQSFYSEARLEKIYKWQEYAYNKWGKDSEYFNSGNIQIKLI